MVYVVEARGMVCAPRDRSLIEQLWGITKRPGAQKVKRVSLMGMKVFRCYEDGDIEGCPW